MVQVLGTKSCSEQNTTLVRRIRSDVVVVVVTVVLVLVLVLVLVDYCQTIATILFSCATVHLRHDFQHL